MDSLSLLHKKKIFFLRKQKIFLMLKKKIFLLPTGQRLPAQTRRPRGQPAQGRGWGGGNPPMVSEPTTWASGFLLG